MTQGSGVRLAGLVLAASLTVAGCGADAQVWEGEYAKVTAEPGVRHCGTESVLFLRLDGEQYVFDPGSAIERDMLVSEPEDDADLPADAVDTGLRRDAAELWLAADGQAAYVVTDDTVQKWPRAVEIIGCD